MKEINLPKEIEEAFNCIDYELSVCNDELPKIKNYITNLQVEVNKLTAESTEWESKCYDLQEENKHLDKVNCHLRKKINNDIYKQRNEEAIEYINEEQQKIDEMGDNYCYLDEYEINDLLNILKGDKDE